MAKELSENRTLLYAGEAGPWERRLVRLLDILLLVVARHWLMVASLSAGGYVGLAALAPYLEYRGNRSAAAALYLVYSFLCHQGSERSFFVFGYQMAICQRCAAIYSGFFVGGLLFGLLRRRLAPLPWKAYLLAVIPLAADGLTQLLGLRESTWLLRLATGGAFSLASIWLVYPHIQRGMDEVEEAAAGLLHPNGRKGSGGEAL